MLTFWDESARTSIVARVRRLTPDATGRWGRMSAPQMLAHLTDACRMALGELPTKPKRSPLRYWPLRELVVYALPFPKGVPTAPELLGRTATDWNAEVISLEQTFDRLVSCSRDKFPEHPTFGHMSTRAWGVLVYRHIDHHLRQFGV
jgi:hypothetical protein